MNIGFLVLVGEEVLCLLVYVNYFVIRWYVNYFMLCKFCIKRLRAFRNKELVHLYICLVLGKHSTEHFWYRLKFSAVIIPYEL